MAAYAMLRPRSSTRSSPVAYHKSAKPNRNAPELYVHVCSPERTHWSRDSPAYEAVSVSYTRPLSASNAHESHQLSVFMAKSKCVSLPVKRYSRVRMLK